MLKKLKIIVLIPLAGFLFSSAAQAQAGKTKKMVEYYPDSVHIKYEYYVLPNDTGYEKHGSYKWFYDDGKLKAKAWFRHDQRDSVMVSYFHSGGVREEVFYRDGQLDGMAKTFYSDGSVEAAGEYVNGRKNGVWKFYSDNGSVVRIEKWDNGKYIEDKP